MKIPEKIETNRITVRKFRATDKKRFLEFMRDEVSTTELPLLKNKPTGKTLDSID